MRTIINIFIATIVAMNACVVAILCDASDSACISVLITVGMAVCVFLGVSNMPEDSNKRANRRDMHDNDMDNAA